MNPLFTSPVVCNTGPLIGLARIDMAWLPFHLFPVVIVPEEVRQELLVSGSPDRQQLLEALAQARIHPCQGQSDRLLRAELDSGEAAVISAALQLGLFSVIIDERKARRVASHVYGLQVKGTAGLLVEAKKRGIIETVGPCLEGIIQAGYFLGSKLVAACLAAAGEGCESSEKMPWTPALTVLSQTDPTPGGGSYWQVTVRDNVPFASHPQRFMRLQVVK